MRIIIRNVLYKASSIVLAACLALSGLPLTLYADDTTSLVAEESSVQVVSTALDLPASTNVYWSMPGFISWDEVNEAQAGYLIKLYSQAMFPKAINVPNGSTTLSLLEYINETDNYYVEVISKANGQHADSLPATSPIYSYTRPTEALQTPTNLRWIEEDNKIYAAFDDVANALGYKVDFFLEGSGSSRGTITSDNKVDITDFITQQGVYYFTVRALSQNIETIANSGISQRCDYEVTGGNTSINPPDTDIAYVDANGYIIFPDQNFKAALLADGKDSGGEITPAQAAAATSVNVTGQGISSISGIEFFTGLKNLWCDNNQITEIDMSSSPNLEVLFCHTNKLTSLDVSNNTALKNLNCGYNQLTMLDISQNLALTNLSCYDNRLTTINLSQNTALTSLGLHNNQLTILDVSQNPVLTELSCRGNQLTNLDISHNTELDYLSCSDNKLSALDISRNLKLTFLSCEKNQLDTLDISKNLALTKLHTYRNRLTAIDVSNNPSLQTLWCSRNYIRSEADVVGLSKSITNDFLFNPQNTASVESTVLQSAPSSPPVTPTAIIPAGSLPSGLTYNDLEFHSNPLDNSARDSFAQELEVSATGGIASFIAANPNWANNAEWIDLSLTDASNGNTVHPIGQITIYLPFTAGRSASNSDFLLLHKTGSGIEVVPFTLTPTGIKFTVDSLSPFSLLWKAKASVSTSSSSKISSGSSRSDTSENKFISIEQSFWDDVLKYIKLAASGETVEALMPYHIKSVPAEVLNAVAGKKKTLLLSNPTTHEKVSVYGGDLKKSKIAKKIYTLSEISDLLGNKTPSGSAVSSVEDLHNPKTGGDDGYIPIASQTFDSPSGASPALTGYDNPIMGGGAITLHSNTRTTPPASVNDTGQGVSMSEEDRIAYIILLSFFALAVILPLLGMAVQKKK